MRAYNSGPGLVVEIDVVMGSGLTLRICHDVAEELQGSWRVRRVWRGLLCMLIMRGCIGRSIRRRIFSMVGGGLIACWVLTRSAV